MQITKAARKKAANLEMDIESGIQMTHFTFFPPITFHRNSSATIMVIKFYHGTVVKTNVKNQLMFCFHFKKYGSTTKKLKPKNLRVQPKVLDIGD